MTYLIINVLYLHERESAKRWGGGQAERYEGGGGPQRRKWGNGWCEGRDVTIDPSFVTVLWAGSTEVSAWGGATDLDHRSW